MFTEEIHESLGISTNLDGTGVEHTKIKSISKYEYGDAACLRFNLVDSRDESEAHVKRYLWVPFQRSLLNMQ